VRVAGELAEPTTVAKGKRTVFLVAGAIGLAIFAAALYFAYSLYFAPEPPPPPPVTKKAPAAQKSAPPPSPAPAPKATPAPTTPVAKAKAVTESRAQVVAESAAPVAAASAPAPAAPSPAPVAPAPSSQAAPAPAPAPAAEPPTARATIAKGVTATTTLEQAGADASVEFRTFVANAKVNGVFQGTPARAFINGRLARAGETVDASLGIVFDRIDADKRHIVFRDRTGATVTRRY
jgi:hypothetical protein